MVQQVDRLAEVRNLSVGVRRYSVEIKKLLLLFWLSLLRQRFHHQGVEKDIQGYLC